jgi:hypothetical protein
MTNRKERDELAAEEHYDIKSDAASLTWIRLKIRKMEDEECCFQYSEALSFQN